jgi:hypothetical protein
LEWCCDVCAKSKRPWLTPFVIRRKAKFGNQINLDLNPEED